MCGWLELRKLVFFFQAEDGIRDDLVTGVQTCALPISLPQPRSELSKYAPRILTIQIPQDRIGDIIGPKGKTIRSIQEQTGAQINVDDSGLITVSGVGEAGERARDIIASMVQGPEVGTIYEGTVKSTTAFAPFIEILPAVEGLLHISELQ